MSGKLAPSPIAIIGIGCRFPGGAHGADRFWSILERGECVIKPTPPERWSGDRHFDPDPNTTRRMYVREGGYLDDSIERFDAASFNISPREAAVMDPQQRLLLEVAAEALEDAQISRAQIAGSNTGVYIGAMTLDYQGLMLRPENVHLVNSHTAAGMTIAAISNRLSHVFDLQGASISIDTACSSSLVAMHYACNDLRSGDVTMALAGGVNITLLPEFLIALCKGGFVSPEARSKAFDIAANGYVRGEGAGVVVLKPLQTAQADGDPIHGVIHASGVNQDGRTDGISRPCAAAQKKLITSVHALAGITPQELSFMETHGTGTQIGDQTEAKAIGETIGRERVKGDPILLGTLKSNIGHLEAAAGVASVIKTVLALRHGVLPKNPMFRTPNPNIDFRSLNLRVPYENEPIYPQEGVRYAGINGFGYGGTNAHLIVSSYDRVSPSRGCETDSDVFFLSAQSDVQLRQDSQSMATHLAQGKSSDRDVCAASARLRTMGPHRMAIPVDAAINLGDALQQTSDGVESPSIFSTHDAPHSGVVFVYSGMGAQYPQMGASLMTSEPAFLEMVERVDGIFQKNWQISPRKMLLASQLPGDRADVPQWTNFILQLGISAMLADWGIRPTGVFGHSAGEVAAAWAAGCLDLDQAVSVAYHRGAALQKLSGSGGMLALGLGYEETMHILADEPDLDLAAINGPKSTTVSGPRKNINRLAKRMEKSNIFHRVLSTTVAYHSRMIEKLGAGISEELVDIAPSDAKHHWISTVSPEVPPIPNGAYWLRNARQPVHFAAATEAFLELGETLFLEIGAHPVLGREIMGTANEIGSAVTCVPTLRRDLDANSAMAKMKAQFFVSGGQANWPRMTATADRKNEALPLPNWADTRFFSESPISRAHRTGPANHPLLGPKLDLPNPMWKSTVSAQFPEFLAGHSILGKVIFPATGYLEMGLAATFHEGTASQAILRDISFIAPLVLQGDKEVLLSSRRSTDDRFVIQSKQDTGEDWTKHAAFHITPANEITANPRDIPALIKATKDRIEASEFYETLNGVGLGYSGEFRQIKRLWRGRDTAIAQLSLKPNSTMIVDPCVMDGALQTALGLLPNMQLLLPKSAKVLTYIEQPSGTCYAFARRTEITDDLVTVDIELLGEDGRLFVAIQGLVCAGLASSPTSGTMNWLYHSKWTQLPPVREFVFSNSTLILNDNSPDEWQDVLACDGVTYQELTALPKCQLADEHQDVIYVCPLDHANWPDAYNDLASFIKNHPASARNQIIVVTQDCQSAVSGDTAGNPFHAGFWGVARSMQLDFANLNIRLIDMPPQKTVSNFKDLMKFCAIGEHQEAALRNGGTYTHTLTALSERAFQENRQVIQKPELHQPLSLNFDGGQATWTQNKTALLDPNSSFLRLDSVTPAPEFSNRFDALATVVQTCGSSFELGQKIAISGELELLTSHLSVENRNIVWAPWDNEKPTALTLTSALEQAFIEIEPLDPVAFHIDDSRNIQATLDWMAGRENPIAVISQAKGAAMCDGHTFFHVNNFETTRDLKRFLGKTGALLVPENAKKSSTTHSDLDLRRIVLKPPSSTPIGVTKPVRMRTETRTVTLTPNLSELYAMPDTDLPQMRPNDRPVPVYLRPVLLADKDGVVLVTGGLSGFGAELAVSLAAQGCHSLALVGRRGAKTPGIETLLSRLRGHGAKVCVLSLDICDRNALEDTLDMLRRKFGKISAVYHSAGLVSSTAPQDLTSEKFRESMNAKCVGAMNLDAGTRGDDLLCFCTIGSVSGLIGNRSQAPYAAANAFLSALSAQRRAAGCASFNAILGAIGSVGQVVHDEALIARLNVMGVSMMDCDALLARLHDLCRLDAYPSAMIADMDWAMWKGVGDTSPIAQLVHAGGVLNGKPNKTGDLSRADLLTVVLAALSTCLETDVSNIADRATIDSLGLDSLLATEVSLFVQTATGLILDPLDVLGAANVGALTDTLEGASRVLS